MDTREMEQRAAEWIGYHAEAREVAPGTVIYQLMRPDGKPHVNNHLHSAEAAWSWSPEYATDLTACWRDLGGYLAARGCVVRIERGHRWAAAWLVTDAAKQIVVRGPADASVADLLLQAFIKAIEQPPA